MFQLNTSKFKESKHVVLSSKLQMSSLSLLIDMSIKADCLMAGTLFEVAVIQPTGYPA